MPKTFFFPKSNKPLLILLGQQAAMAITNLTAMAAIAHTHIPLTTIHTTTQTADELWGILSLVLLVQFFRNAYKKAPLEKQENKENQTGHPNKTIPEILDRIYSPVGSKNTPQQTKNTIQP